jgi:hypothetical protein
MTDASLGGNFSPDGLEWLRHRPIENPALCGLVELWEQRLAVPGRREIVARQEITTHDLDAMNLVGDPIAENFVFAKNAAGLKDSDDLVALEALRRDGCRPAVDLWTAVNTLPPFLNFDEMRCAGAFAYRNLIPFALLQMGAFPFTYTGSNVAHVLEFSGRLGRGGDQLRRYWETTRGTLAAYDIDAMRPGGASWERWIRIRLMHTRVRIGISRSGAWDYRHGTPISALNIAAGLYTFATYILLAGKSMGARPTRCETAATLRLWQWVAYLQGAPRELLLEGLDEQQSSDRELIRYLYRPSGAARRLTDDWIDCVSRGLGKVASPKWFVQACIRHVLSASLEGMPELAGAVGDDLAIPRNRWAAGVVHAVAAVSLVVGQAGHVPQLERHLEHFGRQFTLRSVDKGLGGDDATHQTPLG